jgi:hypothetical protein
MLQTVHSPSGFEEVHRHARLGSRCPRPATAAYGPTVTAVRKIRDAFGEALAACRQYEQLRSSGLPHDAALRESLGISPSKRTCGTTAPLHFAGRA